MPVQIPLSSPGTPNETRPVVAPSHTGAADMTRLAQAVNDASFVVEWELVPLASDAR